MVNEQMSGLQDALQEVSTPNPLPESIRIKVVALVLVVEGLIGILLTLASVVSLFLAFSRLFPVIFLLTVGVVGGSGLLFGYSSFLLWKISASLHRLEEEGYRAAFFHFSFVLISSVIFGIGQSILVSPQALIGTILSLSINGMLLFLLYSHRSRFVFPQIVFLRKKLIVAECLLLLILPLGLVIQHENRVYTERAQQDLIKQIAEEKRKADPEPVVEAWEAYTNGQLKFSMDIPKGWQSKEYPPSAYSHETRIGFDPGELPQDWNPDAIYMSVSVFPVTDTINYPLFQTRLSKVGQPPLIHKSAILGGIAGEETIGTVSVEHEGFVYAFEPHLVEDDALNYTASDISKRSLSSFLFIERGRASGADSFELAGSGMMPSYIDRGVYQIDKAYYQANLPQRGDVVLFDTFLVTPDATSSAPLVKRVVGLPGETLVITGGRVVINGQGVVEPYLASNTQTLGGTYIKEGQPVSIPAEGYVLLGDNRLHSSDSREFGFVSLSQFQGKILSCLSHCTATQ